MFRYIIDENLPANLPAWKKENFVHVFEIADINTDTDIWQSALKHERVIINKDTDFYYRYSGALHFPKIVWIRTGNLRKTDFNKFIEQCWAEAESMLFYSSLIIIEPDKIEGF